MLSYFLNVDCFAVVAKMGVGGEVAEWEAEVTVTLRGFGRCLTEGDCNELVGGRHSPIEGVAIGLGAVGVVAAEPTMSVELRGVDCLGLNDVCAGHGVPFVGVHVVHYTDIGTLVNNL
ncbi:MAG: hypothetical protein DRH08_01530 [Deltaproteobacteria bacterium]|nr:MAG: hypothetical protein DRH08_01530 [Deltaproteobacteria bacterium]